MTKSLFSAFEKVSSKAWKQKIQVDLKGADYNDTLIWKTTEGIDVRPFYHQDEMVETIKLQPQQWSVGQIIFVQNEKASNIKALDAIERGAETIKFIIPNKDISAVKTLDNIDVDTTNIQFELLFSDSEYINNLNTISSTIQVLVDPVGHLATTGNWFETPNNNLVLSSQITVNTTTYQNAGASIVQQLAYGLAHLNEYFNDNSYNSTNLEVVHFNIAVGTNYFFEIAKLRALRALYNTLALEYDCQAQLFVNVIPTKRNKTIYDYNTNMLRTTTECMSAILGGANTVFNLPYDAIYHKDNEFGERIARNQLLILKNESYFDAVNNASDGSYYIETLTSQLAEKALVLFKDIEANGGFIAQLKEGTIQKKIKESANKEQELFDSGKITLLGTNKHPNKNDRMKDELELFPFLKTNPRKTLIIPIIEKRLAETLEQNRLKTE
ncbi:methylmalonyl-CoA mutase subunit beta [Olleya marilimosa]|uniref:Methylmalonyl-CoA mutase subunit beta n=1 Tax=Olleya marilimosa TaxID=272164 RepID=A0ABR8LU35_9FLAO|nr:methylmalonyl-CoA mutase subunit beta [Olleya marilimosa]MBD3862484.1 methylmalonyl-CoA mutase subunit beta [Olleya marilimosa]MBD3889982.1 methylmalonyl-CoA mutase subunit beta [Olleya marilimosa]